MKPMQSSQDVTPSVVPIDTILLFQPFRHSTPCHVDRLVSVSRTLELLHSLLYHFLNKIGSHLPFFRSKFFHAFYSPIILLPFVTFVTNKCNVYKPNIIKGLSQICYMLHSFSYSHYIFIFHDIFLLFLNYK